MRQANSIGKMRLFRALTRTELQTVESMLKRTQCKEGAMVIDEGDKSQSIFLVVSGELSVCRMVRGKVRELASFQPGDHFGEISFSDGQPRSASIRVTKDSELC